VKDLRKLYASRELLYLLAWRDIHVRYKQSLMGLLWAILMPSIIVGAGALVRIGAARMSGGTVVANDIASVIVRAVIWAFIVGAIRFGTGSLIGNPSLVTKIAFPKEVFPIAAVLSNAFDFLVASVVVVAALLFIGWRPGIEALWIIPLLCVLGAFLIGLTMILSALNLFYRDVKYIVEVLLTYAIFFTPVLFPASFAGNWRHLVLLNPVAPILEAASDTLVSHQSPDLAWTTYSAVVALVLLVLGYAFFKRLEAQFAERM
jgi:lipopolysaccharide transport system permease protein